MGQAMSEVKHKGVRKCTGGDGIWSSHVTYDYKSPGVTLPNEDPEKWAELSGPLTVTILTPQEMENYLATRTYLKNRKHK